MKPVPCYFFSCYEERVITTAGSLTKKTTDHSSRDYFAFSFYCDRCGKAWRSGALPFANGGFTRIEQDEVRDMIWAKEHRIAFERANLEAQFHFNHCSGCGRWVCDDCFRPLGGDGYDVCHDCGSHFPQTQGKGFNDRPR